MPLHDTRKPTPTTTVETPDGIPNSACFDISSGVKEITLARITSSIVTYFQQQPEIRSRVESSLSITERTLSQTVLVYTARESAFVYHCHISHRIIFPTGPDPTPVRSPPPRPHLSSHLIPFFFPILRCIAYSAQRKGAVRTAISPAAFVSFIVLICSPPCVAVSSPIHPFPVPSQTYFVSHTLLYPSHNPTASRKRFQANHPKTPLFRILAPQAVITLTKRSASTSATASSTPRHLAKRTAYIKRNDVWVFPPHL